MYPDAKSHISTAAIKMIAATVASLTISLATIIPYVLSGSRQINMTTK
jgi:hypothetical protein